MNKPFNSRTFRFFLPYFLLACAVILAFRISGELGFFVDGALWIWGVISPFFAGFIVAYIINIPISGVQKLYAQAESKPAMQFIQKLLARNGKIIKRLRKPLVAINQTLASSYEHKAAKRINRFFVKRQRMLGVLTVVLILIGIIALTLNLIIPAIITSVQFLIDNAEAYWAGIQNAVNEFNNMDLFGLYIDSNLIFTVIGDLFADFSMDNLAQPLNVLMNLGTAVFNSLIAFIASIYILIEKDRFKAYLSKLVGIFFSGDIKDGIFAIFRGLNNNVRTYIRTQTIDGIILGTMATLTLWAIGSPFALILGLMLGIFNYIPYFGSIFGTIVAVLVVTITQGLGMGAISLGLLLVIQQIDANIIQPRLMSGSFSLSPLLVIISITFGGAVAGILGMFVAIPVVAVLKDIFDSIVDYYEKKKLSKAEGNQPDEAN